MEHMRTMAAEDTQRLLTYFLPFLKARLELLKRPTTITTDENNIKRILKSVFTQVRSKFKSLRPVLLTFFCLTKDRFDVLPQLVDKTLVIFCDPMYDTAEANQYLESIKTASTGTITPKRCCLDLRLPFCFAATLIESMRVIFQSKASLGEQVTHDQAKQLLKECGDKAKELNLKKSDMFQTLRYALTTKKEGFEIPVLIELLGIPEATRRLNLALNVIKSS